MFSLYFLGSNESAPGWMTDNDGRVFVFQHRPVAEIARKHLQTPEEGIEVRPYDGDAETVAPKMERCFDAQGKIKPGCK
jgi:hypothetical protein